MVIVFEIERLSSCNVYGAVPYPAPPVPVYTKGVAFNDTVYTLPAVNACFAIIGTLVPEKLAGQKCVEGLISTWNQLPVVKLPPLICV